MHTMQGALAHLVPGSAYASGDNVGGSWFGLCEALFGVVALLFRGPAAIVELFDGRHIVAATCKISTLGGSCPVRFLQHCCCLGCGLHASLGFCSIWLFLWFRASPAASTR